MTEEDVFNAWRKTAIPKDDFEKEAYEIVEKALEKQIPKKPMISWDEKVKENWYSCGVCAKSFGWKRAIKTMEYNYCPSCGVKIDWE